MKEALIFTIVVLTLSVGLVVAPALAQDVVPLSEDEVLTMRWQAMADFYARHDMLTIHPQQASAYRWQAMGEFYAQHDMLNPEAGFYADAADCLCYRWQALASFYADHDLLTRPAEGTP